MSNTLPLHPGHVGEIVLAYPGRARRIAGFAPCPAVIMQVVAGDRAILLVWHHDGTSELLSHVRHVSSRDAQPDADAHPWWDFRPAVVVTEPATKEVAVHE